MELHSSPLPSSPPFLFFGHHDNLPLFVTQQHPPPGLQSVIKQLFGELSNPVIKLLTGKSEESQLADCIKE